MAYSMTIGREDQTQLFEEFCPWPLDKEVPPDPLKPLTGIYCRYLDFFFRFSQSSAE